MARSENSTRRGPAIRCRGVRKSFLTLFFMAGCLHFCAVAKRGARKPHPPPYDQLSLTRASGIVTAGPWASRRWQTCLRKPSCKVRHELFSVPRLRETVMTQSSRSLSVRPRCALCLALKRAGTGRTTLQSLEREARLTGLKSRCTTTKFALFDAILQGRAIKDKSVTHP